MCFATLNRDSPSSGSVAKLCLCLTINLYFRLKDLLVTCSVISASAERESLKSINAQRYSKGFNIQLADGIFGKYAVSCILKCDSTNKQSVSVYPMML